MAWRDGTLVSARGEGRTDDRREDCEKRGPATQCPSVRAHAAGTLRSGDGRDDLAFVCALEVGPQAQKTRQKPLRFGAIPLRELRAQHVDWLTNTLRRREGIKGPTMSKHAAQ